MKSFSTKCTDTFRNFLQILDYLFWFLFDPFKFKKVDTSKIKKVLIIHLGAIGEILITFPIIHTLKKEIGCEIDYLISPGKEAIVKGSSNVSNILVYNNNFKKNISMLKKGKYDLAVIVAPCNWKMGLLCLKANIPYRVGGFNGVKRGPSFFLNRKTFPIKKKHVVEKNLDIIRQIGLENKNPKMEFDVSKKDEKSSLKKLKSLKVKNYAIVHPGFGFSTKYAYPAKFWPYERYAKIIDFLIESRNLDVLLTGNKEEIIFSEKIIRYVKNKDRVRITNGMFNFGELGLILKKTKLLISTSTGVLHLAESFNIPILELAGKGTMYYLKNNKFLYEWAPLVDNFKLLYHVEKCTGCNMMGCRKKTIECMNAITVEEVKQAITSLLEK